MAISEGAYYSAIPIHVYPIHEPMKQLGRLERYQKELAKLLGPKIFPPTERPRINIRAVN